MEYNVNNTVYIKLTDKGREMHREHWEPHSLGNYQPPAVSIDGYSKFQMHEVMNVFGPACVMGGDLPFHPKIILGSDLPMFLPNPPTS